MKTMPINIVLDCKDPQSPVFVEIEDDAGTGIACGTWKKIKGRKHLFAIRIKALPAGPAL